MAGPPLAQNPAGDHLPAHCCCHVFTATCPVDCLHVVLATATFHALARAERAPFDPPTTVGQVLELLRAGRLGLAFGLGPRRLGEIRAGLVLAGLVLSEDAPSTAGRPGAPGSSARLSEEEEPPSC
jgi:hypothetical protein